MRAPFIYYLLALVSLNLALHLESFGLFLLSFSVPCLIWRLLYEKKGVPLPSWPLKTVLVIISFLLVYTQTGGFLGLEAGTLILIFAVSLKIIDRSRYHDTMTLILMMYFLLLAKSLESQNFTVTLLAGLDLVMMTFFLLQLHSKKQFDFDLAKFSKTCLKLALQISPLMFLLFFVFPRFSSRLSLFSSGSKTTSGFSAEMKPGQLQQLALSQKLAFKAKISRTIPKHQLYWRGQVLEVANEMSWSSLPKKNLKTSSKKFTTQQNEDQVTQEVLLDSRYAKWFFALESATAITLLPENRDLQRTTVNTYRAKTPPTSDVFYKAVSNVSSTHSSTMIPELHLKKKSISDPRLRTYIQSIKDRRLSFRSTLTYLLNDFSKRFKYSLNTKKIKTNSVAEFLFDHKTGFCEHFAISFAAVTRHLDIPSRVVAGFLGGESNPVSGYYNITDADAHAWLEVWDKERNSWLRIDPTQLIAPLRGELGGQMYFELNEEQRQNSQLREAYFNRFESSFSLRLWSQTQLFLDSIATGWNRFLLNYNREAQYKLFSELGLKWRAYWQYLLLCLVLVAIYFLLINKKPQNKKKKHEEYYEKLIEHYEHIGITKPSWMGARDFSLHVKNHDSKPSELAIEMNDKFITLYTKLAYGPNLDNQFKKRELQQLKSLLSKIKKNSKVDR